MELALACTYRVAADDGSINIGLPEMKLGILPGWGGTTRLPRLIGMTRRLSLLLTGKTLPPKKARKMGLIDEAVRPEALLAAAKRLVLKGAGQPRKLSLADRAMSVGPVRKLASSKATQADARADQRQLPRRDADHRHRPRRLRRRLPSRARRRAHVAARADGQRVVPQPDAAVLPQAGAKKADRRAAQRRAPREVKHAAVIGGGTMGAGIAHADGAWPASRSG